MPIAGRISLYLIDLIVYHFCIDDSGVAKFGKGWPTTGSQGVDAMDRVDLLLQIGPITSESLARRVATDCLYLSVRPLYCLPIQLRLTECRSVIDRHRGNLLTRLVDGLIDFGQILSNPVSVVKPR